MNVREIPNPIRYRLRLYKFSLQTDIASNTQLRLWMQHLDQFFQQLAIAVRRFHKNLSDAVANLLLHDLKRTLAYVPIKRQIPTEGELLAIKPTRHKSK